MPADQRPRVTRSTKRFGDYVLPLGAPAIPLSPTLLCPSTTDLQMAAS
jgi:hypothetical protein